MTYRSDHDAALHRLDTLERELAEMRAAKPAELVAVPPVPPRSRVWLALGLAGWLAAMGVGAWKLVGRLDDDASAATEEAPPASDRAELRACAKRTVTLAPCRPLLHAYNGLDLTPDEKGLVAMWARTEDALLATNDPMRHEELLVTRAAVLRDLAL